jgi:hypothetical protein
MCTLGTSTIVVSIKCACCDERLANADTKITNRIENVIAEIEHIHNRQSTMVPVSHLKKGFKSLLTNLTFNFSHRQKKKRESRALTERQNAVERALQPGKYQHNRVTKLRALAERRA